MFVTFEGPEGGGKSSALKFAASNLRAIGHQVVETREPGAGHLGGKIRELLLHSGDMRPESELFLFLADRANHVATVVRPGLAAGAIVLCDRYADSTVVYQCFARNLDEQFVRAGNSFATGGLTPDLTILLDLPPEVGLLRIQSKDRLDAEPIEFHRLVRSGFLRLAKEHPSRWKVIDATESQQSVQNECLAAIVGLVRRGGTQ